MALGATSRGSAQGSNVLSVTSPTFTSTSANLLVANGVSDGHSAEATTPFSDSKSNTWAVGVALAVTSSVVSFVQRYAKNITGGASHTVTYTLDATGFPSIAVVEISGADTTSPFDQPASNKATSTNPHTSGTTATTGQADEICVAGMTHSGGASETFASNNGYTVQTSQTNTANMPIVLSTKIVSATGTQAESYNLTANNSVQYAAGVGTYKAAASAPVAATVAYAYGSN